MGNALFNEYESVRGRDAVRTRCALSLEELDQFTCSFYSICEWVPIFYLWRPNLRDEADNHIVELALAANASAVVTNNIGDFTGSELLFPELSILKPEQWLRRG